MELLLFGSSVGAAGTVGSNVAFLDLEQKNFFFFLSFLGPLSVAHGGSQAKGLIGAVAAGLH